MSLVPNKNPITGSRLVQVFFAVAALYLCRSIIVPALYGFFIAVILYPLCKKLEKIGFKKSLAIATSITLVTILAGGLAFLLFYQFSIFKKDLPSLLAKLGPSLLQGMEWMNANLGTQLDSHKSVIQNLMSFQILASGSWISAGMNGIVNAGVNIIIIPIYSALILAYRTNLKNFVLTAAGEANKEKTERILSKIVHTYGNYIKGMVWVYLIVGILNSLGLLLLGIRYAILFGMLTAVMTIIPYFGIIISSLLPITMAWISTNSIYYPLGVVAIFSFVQYLEGNIIYPWVVGQKVNVNILVSIFSVFAGGLLWGVSGMVLFLPLVAVFKIIADETESLRPISILMGE